MLGDWLKAACLSGDQYLPTSLNRTCIAVLDETSSGLPGPSEVVLLEGDGSIGDPYRFSSARIAAARETYRQKWLTFRENYPNRWFFLLQPGGGRTENRYGPKAFDDEGDPIVVLEPGTNKYYEMSVLWGFFDLLIPQEFLDDPKAFYIPVHREAYNGMGDATLAEVQANPSYSYLYPNALDEIPSDPAQQFTSDWADACSLHTIPNLAAIAVYIDISGSLGMASVQDSYDQFVSYLQSRDMTEIVVTETADQFEDWIGVFDRLLASEAASEPGGWNNI